MTATSIVPRTAVRLVAYLAPRVYLPAFLAHLGEGMLIPTLPLFLRELDLSFTLVSAVLAAAGVGALAGNVPAGLLIARRGEQRVMVLGVLVVASATFGLSVFAAAPALAGARAVAGVGMVAWLLSRQTYMLHHTVKANRGRAMSLLGGVNRAAYLVGPAVGGSVAAVAGFKTAFALAGIVTAAGLVPLVVAHRRLEPIIAGADEEPPARSGDDDVIPERDAPAGVLYILQGHLRTLLSAGLGQLCTATVRQGRFVVIPLYGAAIGLGPTEVGFVLSVSSGLDLFLFPVAGAVMDRYGRMFAIVPAFVTMGIGMALLPLAHSFSALVAVGMLVGLGNGMGSGTMLTLSTDLAPPEAPSQFLGALGLLRDVGKIGGPMIAGLVADAFGLGTASVAIGAAGVLAAVVFAKLVGETHRRHTTPVPA